MIFPFPDWLAYGGPGIAAGVFAVIVGILVSVFMAIVAVFWYPLKRLCKKIRGKKD
jgi:hypothetical protein